jgi:branched-chain amino acid transport system permease protein
MDFAFIVDQGLGILATASVSALVAMGLALSFRLMGIINLASGDFMMIGAYTVLAFVAIGLPYLVGVLAAIVIGFLLGALTEVSLLRRFARAPELAILGTFGLGIVIRQVVELIFGKNFQFIENPLAGSVSIWGAEFPFYRLVLIGVSVAVIGAVLLVLTLTPLGVKVRAVSADSDLAETLGIRSGRLKLLVFAVSTAMASLAGSLIAPLTNVGPQMGNAYLFVMFVVVIVGGARVSMVLVAALAIAIVQNVTTLVVDSLVAKLAILGMAFLVLAATRPATKGTIV